MNPREVLGLQLWLVSHEMITSGSPTEQFEICVSGAYFRGIWIPECGGQVTDCHTWVVVTICNWEAPIQQEMCFSIACVYCLTGRTRCTCELKCARTHGTCLL